MDLEICGPQYDQNVIVAKVLAGLTGIGFAFVVGVIHVFSNIRFIIKLRSTREESEHITGGNEPREGLRTNAVNPRVIFHNTTPGPDVGDGMVWENPSHRGNQRPKTEASVPLPEKVNIENSLQDSLCRADKSTQQNLGGSHVGTTETNLGLHDQSPGTRVEIEVHFNEQLGKTKTPGNPSDDEAMSSDGAMKDHTDGTKIQVAETSLNSQVDDSELSEHSTTGGTNSTDCADPYVNPKTISEDVSNRCRCPNHEVTLSESPTTDVSESQSDDLADNKQNKEEQKVVGSSQKTFNAKDPVPEQNVEAQFGSKPQTRKEVAKTIKTRDTGLNSSAKLDLNETSAAETTNEITIVQTSEAVAFSSDSADEDRCFPENCPNTGLLIGGPNNSVDSRRVYEQNASSRSEGRNEGTVSIVTRVTTQPRCQQAANDTSDKLFTRALNSVTFLYLILSSLSWGLLFASLGLDQSEEGAKEKISLLNLLHSLCLIINSSINFVCYYIH